VELLVSAELKIPVVRARFHPNEPLIAFASGITDDVVFWTWDEYLQFSYLGRIGTGDNRPELDTRH